MHRANTATATTLHGRVGESLGGVPGGAAFCAGAPVDFAGGDGCGAGVGEGGGGGAAGAACPIETEMPNSRHWPLTRANASPKLACEGTEENGPAIRISPLASICGSKLSCGSIAATPDRSRLSLRCLAKISASRAAVLVW